MKDSYLELLLLTIETDDKPSGLWQCVNCSRFLHGSTALELSGNWRCMYCCGQLQFVQPDGLILIDACPVMWYQSTVGYQSTSGNATFSTKLALFKYDSMLGSWACVPFDIGMFGASIAGTLKGAADKFLAKRFSTLPKVDIFPAGHPGSK